MRRVVEEFEERVLIGEIYLPIERLVAYYGRDLSGAHLPFNFALLGAAWQARGIARLIDEYEAALPPGGWPNWVLGNHDRPRVATRVGRDQVRVAAILLLTLRGTPTVYYGEEIGMGDVAIPADRVRDPYEKNIPGIGVGRAPCRTPMQWDSGPHGGFSHTDTWLPLGPDYRQENVANQREEKTSVFNLYRWLIALRRARAALTRGSYHPIAAAGDLIVFIRARDRDRVLVALNLGAEPVALAINGTSTDGRILVSSLGDRDGEAVLDEVNLRSHEGAVIGLDPGAPGWRKGSDHS